MATIIFCTCPSAMNASHSRRSTIPRCWRDITMKSISPISGKIYLYPRNNLTLTGGPWGVWPAPRMGHLYIAYCKNSVWLNIISAGKKTLLGNDRPCEPNSTNEPSCERFAKKQVSTSITRAPAKQILLSFSNRNCTKPPHNTHKKAHNKKHYNVNKIVNLSKVH